MGRGEKLLSALAIRAAKPDEKPYKLRDGGGLYLIIEPQRSAWWRLDYRFTGKQKSISLGLHPAVSLAEARDQADEARKLIKGGPTLARSASKTRSQRRLRTKTASNTSPGTGTASSVVDGSMTTHRVF